jgi:hypothetical protein
VPKSRVVGIITSTIHPNVQALKVPCKNMMVCTCHLDYVHYTCMLLVPFNLISRHELVWSINTMHAYSVSMNQDLAH